MKSVLVSLENLTKNVTSFNESLLERTVVKVEELVEHAVKNPQVFTSTKCAWNFLSVQRFSHHFQNRTNINFKSRIFSQICDDQGWILLQRLQSNY